MVEMFFDDYRGPKDIFVISVREHVLLTSHLLKYIEILQHPASASLSGCCSSALSAKSWATMSQNIRGPLDPGWWLRSGILAN